MYTNQPAKGIVSNYAVEPSVTCATYTIADEQNRYVTQEAMATLLVAVTIISTLIVS